MTAYKAIEAIEGSSDTLSTVAQALSKKANENRKANASSYGFSDLKIKATEGSTGLAEEYYGYIGKNGTIVKGGNADRKAGASGYDFSGLNIKATEGSTGMAEEFTYIDASRNVNALNKNAIKNSSALSGGSGKTYIDTSKVRTVAKTIRQKKEDIDKELTEKIIPAINELNTNYVGISKEAITDQVNKVFKDLDTRLDSLIDILDNSVAGGYENLGESIQYAFNSEFKNKFEELININSDDDTALIADEYVTNRSGVYNTIEVSNSGKHRSIEYGTISDNYQVANGQGVLNGLVTSSGGSYITSASVGDRHVLQEAYKIENGSIQPLDGISMAATSGGNVYIADAKANRNIDAAFAKDSISFGNLAGSKNMVYAEANADRNGNAYFRDAMADVSNGNAYINKSGGSNFEFAESTAKNKKVIYEADSIIS